MMTEEWNQEFGSRVEQINDCWLWNRARTSAGYGVLYRERKQVLAHRLSWEIANNRSALGRFVLHHCDNPGCIRPEHLFLGTQSDNMRDMVEKGRFNAGNRRRGAAHPLSKIGRNQTLAMRALHTGGLAGSPTLARLFNISVTSARNILAGRHWTLR